MIGYDDIDYTQYTARPILVNLTRYIQFYMVIEAEKEIKKAYGKGE